MADLTDNPRPDEDYRVRLARELLAESRAADSVNPGIWWGKFEATVEQLLAFIDEQVTR